MRHRILLLEVLGLLVVAGAAGQSFPIEYQGRPLVSEPFAVRMAIEAVHHSPFGWQCDGLQGDELQACMGGLAECRGEVIGEGDHLLARFPDCYTEGIPLRGWRGWRSIDWWPNGQFYAFVIDDSEMPSRQRLEVWTVHQDLIVRRQVTLEWDGHVPALYEPQLAGFELVWHLEPTLPGKMHQAGRGRR